VLEGPNKPTNKRDFLKLATAGTGAALLGRLVAGPPSAEASRPHQHSWTWAGERGHNCRVLAPKARVAVTSTV
jgi:hypothetical protein